MRSALLLACVLVAPARAGEERTHAAGDAGRRIVAFVERAESVGFTGAVLAARGGEVVAAAAAGSADLAGEVPNTPATLFEIASATKQFTAAAVLRLVQDGRLGLDDSIAKHLPGVPADCKAITVRHLLQHTSGIPGTNSRGGGDDLARVLPLFLRGGPQHEPGSHWEYWNQGYALASEVVARAARTSYVAFCRKALFAPAGMSVTCFTGDPAPKGATVAVGRSSRGSPRSALAHPYGSYGFQYRGMGGVVTSVWDLWRWDRALRGDAVFGEAAKAALFEPGLKDYALGWFVRESARGRVVQSHGGGVRGFVCDVRRYPTEDGCLFVLCNRDDVPAYRVAKALEEILFGDPRTIRTPPRPIDADLAGAIEGRYESGRGNVLVVERDGKTTRARILWSPPKGPVTGATLGLDDDGEVVLYEWTAATPVAIKRGAKGAVKSLSIRGDAYRRVR